MTTILNCTPHAIVLNDGRSFPPSGVVARVAFSFNRVADVDGIAVYRNEAGDVTGLPDFVEGTFLIVSAMVLDANNRSRNRRPDLLAPSTGLASTTRNEAGHIVSVEGFVS